MSEPKNIRKEEENAFIPWEELINLPIVATGKARNIASPMGGVTSSSEGNTSPGKTESGMICRCITCSYQAPIESFMSTDKLVFNGCPECGQIDRAKLLYLTPDGIIPSEANMHPSNFDKDFSKYVDQPNDSKSKPRSVEHQFMSGIVTREP